MSELKLAIDEAVERFGSLHNAAKVLGVTVGYLSRLRSGHRDNPSRRLQRRLGVERYVGYRRLTSKQQDSV